ncbi:hypothetical protein SpCBS45565_g00363 [Spizellomyces sp. 'palustris']|nr:hypothetical protein SpCBS45565_g00363 [Spizellomyces sp. 'palustris']
MVFGNYLGSDFISHFGLFCNSVAFDIIHIFIVGFRP